MITDVEYVEIELLRKHGMSLRKIAEEGGKHRYLTRGF